MLTRYKQKLPEERPDEKSSVEKRDDQVLDSDVVALRAIKTVKLWKLQKGTDRDIKALDRIKREIVRCKSSQAHQTTILRLFKPK